jgi:hypothetical protein
LFRWVTLEVVGSTGQGPEGKADLNHNLAIYHDFIERIDVCTLAIVICYPNTPRKVT